MPCQRCEKMRLSLRRMWRGVIGTGCEIPGCPNAAVAYLCTPHWRLLPLSLRMRWWEETDYGRRRPSHLLLTEVMQELRRQP